jgi:molybdopterin converting factor small subunit
MVRVSLYGNLAEAIGREVELEVVSGETVGAARQALSERFPEAAALLGHGVRACLDDVIVDDDAVVRHGAELGLSPPLSGG